MSKFNTKTEYIYIPKNTYESFKISQDHCLTEEELVKIVVAAPALEKLIHQKGVSIQFDIGEGKWKGQEDLGLEVVKALDEIAKEIKNSKETFNKYRQKQLEEEEKTKNDTEEA